MGKMYPFFGWKQLGLVPGTLAEVGSVNELWAAMCHYHEGIDPVHNMPEEGMWNLSLETTEVHRMTQIPAANGD